MQNNTLQSTSTLSNASTWTHASLNTLTGTKKLHFHGGWPFQTFSQLSHRVTSQTNQNDTNVKHMINRADTTQALRARTCSFQTHFAQKTSDHFTWLCKRWCNQHKNSNFAQTTPNIPTLHVHMYHTNIRAAKMVWTISRHEKNIPQQCKAWKQQSNFCGLFWSGQRLTQLSSASSFWSHRTWQQA